jgi:hypothetical protein
MPGPKPLASTFVDLDLNTRPLRMRDGAPADRTYRVSRLLSLAQNLVLLGDPGAGKTTSVKRLLNELMVQSRSDLRIPLLIRLRDLSKEEHLLDVILGTLGITIDPEKLTKPRFRRLQRDVIALALRELGVCLLLDGLDEAHHAALDQLIDEIRTLLLRTDGYRIILTCRTGDFFYSLPNALIVEISPLSGEQVRKFGENWLGPKKARGLIKQIRSNPYAGSEIRPLTLAQLCAIFERTGRVPEKPKSVYRMIVHLYVQDWDMQRAVKRPSRYANFELDRKQEFLEALAYVLTVRGARATFTHEELREAYGEVCGSFSLPERDAQKVAREIESHTGLVLESGRDEYEFAHKSLQEFLTAQYVSRLPRLPDREILLGLPSELAIAVVLSSDASTQFSGFVRSVLSADGVEGEDFHIYEFTFSFVNRVILERAEFQACRELAAAALVLFAHAYHNKPAKYDKPQRNAFEDLVSRFFGLPGTADSLHALGKYLRFYNTSEENYRASVDYYFLIADDKYAAGVFTRARRPEDIIIPSAPFAHLGFSPIR